MFYSELTGGFLGLMEVNLGSNLVSSVIRLASVFFFITNSKDLSTYQEKKESLAEAIAFLWRRLPRLVE